MRGDTDTTVVESAGRIPFLALAGFSLLWLVASGVLALITSIQAHAPGFLANCPLFTYGRARALEETAFVYGWIGNAGLGLVLWILGRLAGEPLRAIRWTVAGCLFWNIGIAVGMAGIALGDGTSVPFLQMPSYVLPLLLVAYGAVGVAGVLAWTSRRRELMFAAHWYAVAALFMFPWIFSAAQTMLVWVPARGVLQAVVGGWFVQGMWSLWIAPMALACAYYVVPRVKGSATPAYDLAPLGFWTLVFVGAWTGGRHLISGPVPAWISTTAIVACFILIVHYIIVAINLGGALRQPQGAVSLKFVAFGLLMYLAGGLADCWTSIRATAEFTQFTWFDQAVSEAALYGAASMMFFGALYFAVPRISGRPWASAGLVKGHLTLSILGVALLVVSLAAAGLVQGRDLDDARVAFSDIGAHTAIWLTAATVAEAILLLGNLMLILNFARTACPRAAVLSTEALVS